MKIALLGDDVVVLPLIRSIVAHPQHVLSHVVGSSSVVSEVMKLAPSVRVVPHWEELLPAESLGAVVIAGHSSTVLEGAKQLASAAESLMIFPHAAQGSAWVYELTLIRDDTRALLFPVFPLRVHPTVQALRERIAAGSLGRLLYLQFERTCDGSAERGSRPLLSAGDVDEALLSDVDLLRTLGGDYNQVTALFSGRTDTGTSMATVTLAGGNLPEACWSMTATTTEPTWRLKVTGEKGSLTLSGHQDPEKLTLTLAADGSDAVPDSSARDFDSGTALLAQFAAARLGERVHPDWTDLTRAFEVVDGARRSLKRRRTIDLHFETMSERSQFKTQMTAIGCGVLTLTFLAVVLVLAVNRLFDPRGKVETAAESAGSIIYRGEFVEVTAELSETTRSRLAQIAERMPNARFSVIIEAGTNAPNSGEFGYAETALDRQHRENVVRVLDEFGVSNAAERTIVAPLAGTVFRRVLQIAWVVVFLPLFAFLAFQLLLLVARPSTETPANQNPV